MDANFANGNEQIVLGGHEDGAVRLYDLREAAARQRKKFDAHTRYVSQVRFNPRVEQVFLTSALDGMVKMWDLRNDQVPLCVLKRGNDEGMT